MAKKLLSLLAAIAIFTLPLCVFAQDNPPSQEISFVWAFINRSPSDSVAVIDFDTSPVIRSGEELRIYLKLYTQTYIYVLLFDSQKTLHILFPMNPELYEKVIPESREYFLPSLDDWYSIDESVGTEEFHLLASSTRLTKLESIARKYLKTNRDALKGELLREMREVRLKNSRLASATEKGIPITGTIHARGLTGEVTGSVTEVYTHTFYSRTLRLSHE